jgi:hypothetical protein
MGQWVKVNRHAWAYNAIGQYVMSSLETWSQDELVYGRRSTFTYDGGGNRVGTHTEVVSNGQWMNSRRSTFTYDSKGNNIARVYHLWSINEWQPANGSDLLIDDVGNEYWFRGHSVELSYWKVVTAVLADDEIIPAEFVLEQNYPNPFNPVTTIHYSLPISGRVCVKVYNVLGQEVATLIDEVQEAGLKSLNYDASNLTSGVYFLRLISGDFTATKQIMLLR